MKIEQNDTKIVFCSPKIIGRVFKLFFLSPSISAISLINSLNKVNPNDKAAGITIGMIFPCENPKNMKDIPITIETTIFPIRGAPFSFKLQTIINGMAIPTDSIVAFNGNNNDTKEPKKNKIIENKRDSMLFIKP